MRAAATATHLEKYTPGTHKHMAEWLLKHKPGLFKVHERRWEGVGKELARQHIRQELGIDNAIREALNKKSLPRG